MTIQPQGGTIQGKGSGLLTMKVDQNPLAENPDQGVAQCYAKVESERQITEACEPLRFGLQNKESQWEGATVM